MIKGASPSRSLLILVQSFLDREEADQSLTWIERVPSASNIADLPSHAGSVEHMQYELCGGVLHVGKVVTAGHYQAFYFPGPNDDLWQSHLVHDDDSPAVQGTAATRQAICNCYLLAYRLLSRV